MVNTELAASYGVEPDWIERRVGVVSRRFAAADEAVVDMAAGAALAALRAAGACPQDVDMVVLATCSMPSGLPNGAASVAARLGLTVAAFDVNAACSARPALVVDASHASAGAGTAAIEMTSASASEDRTGNCFTALPRVTALVAGETQGTEVPCN